MKPSIILPAFLQTVFGRYACPRCARRVFPEMVCAAGVYDDGGTPRFGFAFRCECGAGPIHLMTTVQVPRDLLARLVLREGVLEEPAPRGFKAKPLIMRLRLTTDGSRQMNFTVFGGYRAASASPSDFGVYILCRAELEDGTWDAVLQIEDGWRIDLKKEVEGEYLPVEDWPSYFRLRAGSGFKLGGTTWRKLGAKELRRLIEGKHFKASIGRERQQDADGVDG